MALKEPEPLQTQIGLKLVAGPLTPDKLGEKPGDVRQGSIANCPVASLMIALAHARKGELGRMLGAPKTGKLISEWHQTSYESNFYYEVTFPGQKPVQITPQLFMREESVLYAETPDGPGWPSYIEKAYAVFRSGGSGGTYEALQRLPLTDVAQHLIGKHTRIDLSGEDAREKVGQVIALAKNAKKKPTVAGSRDDPNKVLDIVPWHGYAVLRMDKDGIWIQNPQDGVTKAIDPIVFHLAFKEIVQAK